MVSRAGDLDGGRPEDLHWGWYVLGLVAYVALALASLALRDNVLILNWIFGPLFPLVAMYLVPRYTMLLFRRVRR